MTTGILALLHYKITDEKWLLNCSKFVPMWGSNLFMAHIFYGPVQIISWSLAQRQWTHSEINGTKMVLQITKGRINFFNTSSRFHCSSFIPISNVWRTRRCMFSVLTLDTVLCGQKLLHSSMQVMASFGRTNKGKIKTALRILKTFRFFGVYFCNRQ